MQLFSWILLTVAASAHGARQMDTDAKKQTRTNKMRYNMKPKLVFVNPNSTTYMIERLLHYYDRQEPPTKDRPTEVRLGIYINSFYSISEQTMDYSVSMYLRQEWRDPRLEFQQFQNRISVVRLEEDSWNKIWIPDTFFRNEKRATFHEVTVDNRLVRLNKTGHVWYVTNQMNELQPTATDWTLMDLKAVCCNGIGSRDDIDTSFALSNHLPQLTLALQRLINCTSTSKSHFSSSSSSTSSCVDNIISATLSCPMRLQKYPMDTQSCPMMFESFGYTMDVMYFSWLSNPIEIDNGIELPQFKLRQKILFDCSQNYTGGAFPCLEIRFVLRRDFGYFVIQVYVPSMLIVILSWVSFWINVDASPARVSIGLLTVLTTTTQSTGINSSLPRVSYVKAIDVWMSACLVFVFTALLEYAVVNVLARRRGVRILHSIPRPQFGMHLMQQQQPPPPSNAESQLDQISVVENGGDRRRPPKVVDPEGKNKARRIDKISRKMFPLAFILFNIVYWLVYLIPFSDSNTADPTSV